MSIPSAHYVPNTPEEIKILKKLATECGSQLNILFQSSIYFLQKYNSDGPGTQTNALSPRIILFEKLRLYLCKYQSLLHQSSSINPSEPNLWLWQLPLGLLLSLKLLHQEEQISHFFASGPALPIWYENTFLLRCNTTLTLKAALTTSWEQLPWSLPRQNAKSLLRFRLQSTGLRCSTDELLLFLNFAPLSHLFGLTAPKLQKNAGQTVPQLGELLALLDFQIFELFGQEIFSHDMLQLSYREGLQLFWEEQYAAI